MRVALFGNVNTEEIIARRLVQEGVSVDGFLLFPNEAFAKNCDKVVVLSCEHDDYVDKILPALLKQVKYDVILLGPDFMVDLVSETLLKNATEFIGATSEQISFETDKSLIHRVFPGSSEILPESIIIHKSSFAEAEEIIARFTENEAGFVLKFVGNYSDKYPGSPVGRVRLSDETIENRSEALTFIKNSVEASGKCIIEKKIHGKEFSSNYAVDEKGNWFRFGENACFKRREDGNQGLMCDGTGSISINNTVPFLTESDISFIETRILAPFCSYVSINSRKPLRAILNLDLMKADDGRIILFEVNVREAGGHTMANILSGLKTPLHEILLATQTDTLYTIQPVYKKGASIVVSAFPPYFPLGEKDEDLLIERVTKNIPPDINLFTGWVDVLEDNNIYRTLRLRNSPTLLFEHFNTTIRKARDRIYEAIKDIVPPSLKYRKDIGTGF